MNQIPSISKADFDAELFNRQTPVIVRDLVAHWPLVAASKASNAAADAYLRSFYRDASVQAFTRDADAGKPFAYNEDLSGLNFQQVTTKLDTILDKIGDHQSASASETHYMGSTTLDYCLPSLSEENSLPFGDISPLTSIWIGNQTTVPAHYDVPDNLACVCAGKRRFTLFPPDQLANLYIGPLDLTPAGQPISLVDIKNPDFDQHPKYKEAVQQAQVADLEAGDGIFIPSMWWHHVESFSDLNILINYWWKQSEGFLGHPPDALLHGIMALRDLPPEQRKIWQKMFDHYVFNVDEDSTSHLPPAQRGILSPLTEDKARQLRAQLLSNLNR